MRIALVLLSVCVALAASVADARPAAQMGGFDLTGWKTLEMTPGKILATGGSPTLTSKDGKLRLTASKVIVRIAEEKGRRAVTATEASGSVTLVLREAGQREVKAVCRSASIRPAENRAVLTGGVRVTSRDSSGSQELTSDAVTIYLKEQRIVATSSPKTGRLSSGSKPRERP